MSLRRTGWLGTGVEGVCAFGIWGPIQFKKSSLKLSGKYLTIKRVAWKPWSVECLGLVGATCHYHLLFLGCPDPGPATSHLPRVPRLCQGPSQTQRMPQRGWCREQAGEESLGEICQELRESQGGGAGSQYFSSSLLH